MILVILVFLVIITCFTLKINPLIVLATIIIPGWLAICIPSYIAEVNGTSYQYEDVGGLALGAYAVIAILISLIILFSFVCIKRSILAKKYSAEEEKRRIFNLKLIILVCCGIVISLFFAYLLSPGPYVEPVVVGYFFD
jgi:membrane protease YdiL (CAAX protease family)